MKYLHYPLALFILFTLGCSEEKEPVNTKKERKEFAMYETYNIEELMSFLVNVNELCMEVPDSTSLSLSVRKLEDKLIWGMKGQIAYVPLSNMAYVDSILQSKCAKGQLPDDVKFVWSAKPFKDYNNKTDQYILYAIKVPDERPRITNRDIASANAEFDTYNQEPCVRLEMTDKGANKWYDMTTDNVGRSIAMVVNDRVYSCPIVNEAISGGTTQISGNMTLKEAEELAAAIY